jgi:hypothetical protein
MSYENFRVTTFMSEGYINQKWAAPPPADMNIDAFPGVAVPKPMEARTGASPAINLNYLDQLYLRRFAVFSNFADGLIQKNNPIQVLFGLGYYIGTAPALAFGTITLTVPYLNVWDETNIFISSKALVKAAVDAGTIDPSANSLHLFCRILAPGTGATYNTRQINPALANTVSTGSPPGGTSNVIFSILAEVEHTYTVT